MCFYFCLHLYLFIEQWNSVHKDLVTMCYSCLHLFLNVMSLAKNHNDHSAKSKRDNLRKLLHNESNFEFILLYCFRSTQNHQKREKLLEKHCIHSLKSHNQVLTFQKLTKLSKNLLILHHFILVWFFIHRHCQLIAVISVIFLKVLH